MGRLILLLLVLNGAAQTNKSDSILLVWTTSFNINKGGKDEKPQPNGQGSAISNK
ncbi:MAG: hypothetical protein U5N85_15180 [Arcicella sp.]|nr:hypothetical protein [Arcicella sp.]